MLVYMILFIAQDEYVFISYTRQRGRTKLAKMQYASPFALELLGEVPGGPDKVAALREDLAADHERGHWFYRSETVDRAIRDALDREDPVREAVLRHSSRWAATAAWEAESNAAAAEAGFLQVQGGRARRTAAGDAWVAGA
jgi:hypothetical protein